MSNKAGRRNDAGMKVEPNNNTQLVSVSSGAGAANPNSERKIE